MYLRKLMCALLAAMLLLAALPTAMAATVNSGSLINGGTWTLDDQGVLTLNGTGEFTWEDRDAIPVDQDTITKVVFGRYIKYEGGAFSYNYSLTAFEVNVYNATLSVQNGVLFDKNKTTLIECPTAKEGSYTVPSTVKTIGHDAFMGSQLSSITLPEGLQTIEYQAFWNAEIGSLNIPASVTEIENTAFGGNNLVTLTVASGNARYRAENNMLIDKQEKSLVAVAAGVTGNVTVPVVEYVESRAFSYTNTMNSVTFQEGLVEIGENAFSGANFREIHLPVSLESIQYSAFDGCTRMTDVYYAGTKAQWAQVDKEGNDVLNMMSVHCSDGDTEATGSSGQLGENVFYTLTPDGTLTVTGAGEWDESWYFEDNTYVKKVVLESGVTEIGYGGFAWCPNLTEVTIPNTVTTIHNNAFYNCGALRKLTIPASVTTIEDEAFDDSDRLNDIYFGGTTAQWQTMIDEGSHNDIQYITIHCSNGTIEGEPRGDDEYGQCGPDAHYSLDPDEDFEGEYDLFVYGSGELYPEAFEGMFEGKTIRLYVQTGITGISDYAFMNVSGIYYVELHSDLQSIGVSAFAGTNVQEVTFVGTTPQWQAVSIGTGNDPLLNAEIDCVHGDEEVFPCGDGVEYCVNDDGEVELRTMGYGSIDAHFFENWTNLECLVLEGVTRIGDYAFNGCTGVSTIYLSSQMEEVGDHALDGISEDTYIHFWGTREEWNNVVIGEGNACLKSGNVHCEDDPDDPDDPYSDLEVTYLPEDLREIEASAFMGSALQKVFVPSGCTIVGDYAFANCSELRFIDMPNVTSIGDHAFDGCTDLTIYTSYDNDYVVQYAENHGIPYEQVGE